MHSEVTFCPPLNIYPCLPPHGPALDTARLVAFFTVSMQTFDDRWKPVRTSRGPRRGTKYELVKKPPWMAWAETVLLDVFPFVGEVVVQFTLTTAATDDNILSGDIDLAIRRVDGLLQWALSPQGGPLTKVPSVVEWFVRRADIFINFKPTVAPFLESLDALLALQPSRRGWLKILYGNSTAYFKSSAKRPAVEITIYDKSKEAMDNHRPQASKAAGLIRIEVRVLSRAAVSRAVDPKNGPPFNKAVLADLFDVELLRRIMIAKLKVLEVQPGVNSVLLVFPELKKRLGARTARRLAQYAQLRGKMPRSEVCSYLGLSARTAKKYEAELRGAGLYVAAVAVEGIIEDVIAQIEGAGA